MQKERKKPKIQFVSDADLPKPVIQDQPHESNVDSSNN